MPEPQRPHAAHLRLGRISLPGQVYVLTMVTRNRQSVFRDFACARTVVRVLREHDRRGVARTLCFVVMPDHVHWMMGLGTVCDLGEAVRTLKSLVSRRIGRPVFQKAETSARSLSEKPRWQASMLASPPTSRPPMALGWPVIELEKQ